MKICLIVYLITILLVIAQVESGRKRRIYNVKNARRLFKEYSKKFNWTFKRESEEEDRFAMFVSNLKLINRHNSNPNTKIFYEIGPYHHLNPKEFLSIYQKVTDPPHLIKKGLMKDLMEVKNMKNSKKSEE